MPLRTGRHAWYKTPTMARVIPHANLWHRIDRNLEWRRKDVVFRRTPGHSTYMDVLNGKTTCMDGWGIGGADKIAQLAKLNAVHGQISYPHVWDG